MTGGYENEDWVQQWYNRDCLWMFMIGVAFFIPR